ncbi:hypothetical protein BDV34DRAFT_191000 [Aspergillus parasiticus]|uniref:Glycosyltransferase family 25 protein n=1 Tax=Aspergillus parasiticus TaxID=5067 RepID=A0A5N6DS87_ASPPA|nr:hypothetical protein BDV34DRAFT_191000 [Aspergillus parasiticus]
MFLATRQLLLVGTAASFLLLLWYMQRIFVFRTVSLPAPMLTPTPTPTPADLVSTTAKSPLQHAGNSTLGFQSILALSTGPSWRTRGLVAAASLTGLDIQIPPQPPINPNLVDAFEHLGPDDVQHPSHGASIAWLAHLDLIKHTIQANLDTVLIIEDDVDWDVSIRSQMVQIAESVRNLTHIDTLDQDTAPYGRDWEVLWIGHCGEYWEEQFETILYDDPTACPHNDYFGWAKQYIERLPDRQRAVYRSVNPVCSFAYALSREGSRKILELLGGAQDEAFDVSMMHACKAGQLKCISVVPEVVHQYFPAQSFGVKSAVDVGNGQEPGPEEAEFEHVMGSTENILESARCRALWGRRCLRKQ